MRILILGGGGMSGPRLRQRVPDRFDRPVTLRGRDGGAGLVIPRETRSTLEVAAA